MTTDTVNRRSLLTLKYFNFFLFGSTAILLSFFPLFFQEAGLSKVTIGIIMAGGPFVSIFANPFWGYWSDRLQNLKRVLLILLTGNLIVVQLVFHVDSSLLIFAAMLVFFFFQTPLFSQNNSLILNTIEGTSYQFGAFRLWGSLGWALMAVAAGPVLDWLGIRHLWVIYSFLLLITLAFTSRLPRGKVGEVRKIDRGEYGQALFGNKYFLVFVILGVLISVPNSINQTFVSLYIDKLGGSVSLIGWSSFTSAILEVPAFILFDRFLKKRTLIMVGCLIFVSLLYVLRWFLMALATGPVAIVFIQTLHSITFGGYYYIGTILTAHLIPSHLRASGQAVYALSWGGVSGVIAGLLGGWMFQALGPTTMYDVITIVASAGVIGFIVLWLWVRKDAKSGLAEN